MEWVTVHLTKGLERPVDAELRASAAECLEFIQFDALAGMRQRVAQQVVHALLRYLRGRATGQSQNQIGGCVRGGGGCKEGEALVDR